MSKENRILIFVTGIGLGDAVRDHTIIKELQKIRKIQVKIATYGIAKTFFKSKFPTTEIRGFNATSKKFRLEFRQFVRKNATLPLTWTAQIKKLQEEIKDFRPDLVITDFEPLGVLFPRRTETKFIEVFGVEPRSFEEFWEKEKRTLFQKIQANFLRTMYKAGNSYGEAVIIPTYLKTKNFEKFNFVNPIVKRLEGEQKKVQKGLVVVFGGSTFGVTLGNLLLKVLPKINEKFIIFGLDEWISQIKVKFDNIKFKTLKEDTLSYIKNSSGVITLGGQLTIHEALFFKKPLLSFPIPDHIEQQYNAYLLEKMNLALVKKEWPHKGKEEFLEQSIKEFLEKREELEVRVKKANIKGDGGTQSAKIISHILG